MRPVVLASSSERREMLLREIVPEFEILRRPVNEDAYGAPSPWKLAEGLAKLKAMVGRHARPDALVIGGDTVVALPEPPFAGSFRDDRLLGRLVGRYLILGKPHTHDEARRMLKLLSGKAHEVVTGVAILSPEGEKVFSETTSVVFRNLDESEILAYVATGEPMDKAGAYAFQGMARPFIQQVVGSSTNVIGLPIERLREELDRFPKGE